MDCPICKEQMNNFSQTEESNGVYINPHCKHKFHTDCYVSWCSQSNGNCPLCRHEHLYLNNMEYTGRLSFLRKYSLCKECPDAIKKLGDNLRDSEKDMKNCRKELRKTCEKYKEILDEVRELKTKRFKYTEKYHKAQNRLIGVPILEIPPSKRILVQHQEDFE